MWFPAASLHRPVPCTFRHWQLCLNHLRFLRSKIFGNSHLIKCQICLRFHCAAGVPYPNIQAVQRQPIDREFEIDSFNPWNRTI